MRILILPDKFKGTLTATEAAAAIADGWHDARPGDALELLPMSDGGDGFGEVISRGLGASARKVRTVDAAGRACVAEWWWEPRRKHAIIESARAVGLAMLPKGRFHPSDLDTAGLAPLLTRAAANDAAVCTLGIGGSATNDGGFGVARALGWQFIDGRGQPISRWTKLKDLAGVVPPEDRRWPQNLVVAVDVQNRLLGPKGCTRVYGPQKGLTKRDFKLAEACLGQLEKVVGRWAGRDLGGVPGTGAAGGLGFGLLALLGAALRPGFEVFAEATRLAEKIARAELVITGEGRFDNSSSMGKGVGEVRRLCAAEGKPCIILAGDAEPSSRRDGAEVHALTDLTSPGAAQMRAAYWLRELASRAAQLAEKPLPPRAAPGRRRTGANLRIRR